MSDLFPFVQEVVRKPHEYTSMKSLNEPKRGFWGSLASKAKALLDEDPHDPQQSPTRTEQNIPSSSSGAKVGLRFITPFYNSY